MYEAYAQRVEPAARRARLRATADGRPAPDAARRSRRVLHAARSVRGGRRAADARRAGVRVPAEPGRRGAARRARARWGWRSRWSGLFAVVVVLGEPADRRRSASAWRSAPRARPVMRLVLRDAAMLAGVGCRDRPRRRVVRHAAAGDVPGRGPRAPTIPSRSSGRRCCSCSSASPRHGVRRGARCGSIRSWR